MPRESADSRIMSLLIVRAFPENNRLMSSLIKSPSNKDQAPSEGLNNFDTVAVFINELDYSIIRFCQRASERMPREKGTRQYFSISNGLINIMEDTDTFPETKRCDFFR